MSLAAPYWLLLLPALLLLGWRFPQLGVRQPLRALAIILLVLVLAQPQWRPKDKSLDLWVLLDQSASTEDRIEQSLNEVRGILNREKPNDNCRIHLVDFGAGAITRVEGRGVSEVGRSETQLRTALYTAASLADGERSSRILVLGDGQSTEPLDGTATRLNSLGIPVDIRLLPRPSGDDWRISKFESPPMVRPLEPTPIAVEVKGPTTGEATLRITRDGVTALEQKITLEDGTARLDFTDRLQGGGGHRYVAEIVAEEDTRQGNNKRESVVSVQGDPRVVLATGYEGDYLADVIREQGFEVTVIAPDDRPDAAILAGARAIVLNNRRADTLSRDFSIAAARLVDEQGGGLLMLGGLNSFGSGGWFDSPIDATLPVSMELKEEHRKLRVALSIGLDRSGSMSATVAGAGAAPVQKIHLAGEGAARAIELLGHQDLVSLHVVDTAAHEIAPLTLVGPNRAKLANLSRSIQSMGGGIFVYESLSTQWASIKNAPVPNKHLILFADAADSEQPLTYKMLIDEIVAAGANISVIGLGTNMDKDAELLRDIANRGGGRLFFTNRAVDLPEIFSQEVASVTRSLFLREPIALRQTGQWPEISQTALAWPAEIDAANITYLREGAASAVMTNDEYSAPLVAWHRKGLGRSAVACFPFGGEYSDAVRAWSQSGDLVQSLVRWAGGPPLPPGIALRSKLIGNQLRLTLAYDAEAAWQEKFATNPPQLKARTRNDEALSEIAWRRLSPGQLEAEIALPPGALASGVVTVGDTSLPFGPITAGESPEWSDEEEPRRELRALVAATGGRELADLADAWLPPVTRVLKPLAPLLLIAALSLILIEALLSRTGRQLPQIALPDFAKRRSTKRTKTERKKTKPAQGTIQAPQPIASEDTDLSKPEQPPSEEENEAAKRRSRYQKAKRRSKM